MGTLSNGTIHGSHASGFVVSSDGIAGGLVGQLDGGVIGNSHASGSVNSSSHGSKFGGLVGEAASATIHGSHVTGEINGASLSCGPVGQTSGVTLRNSNATGAVFGQNYIGGLVGEAVLTEVRNCHAIGSVRAWGKYADGLIDQQRWGATVDSYSMGIVSSSPAYHNDPRVGFGGLVGKLESALISCSYATGGVVVLGQDAGGLVGRVSNGTISNSFATGMVSGSFAVGGLIGCAAQIHAGFLL